jgi:hypothetical protein
MTHLKKNKTWEVSVVKYRKFFSLMFYCVSVFRLICNIAKSDYCHLASSCLSVCPFVLKTPDSPTGRIFMKSDVRLFFENLLRIFNFY